MLLAQGLARAYGQTASGTVHVTVATPTAADGMDDGELPFRVARQPGLLGLLKLLWQADIVHLAGPCLLPMMIGLALRKPVVVEHHGYQAICPNGLLFYEPDKSICPGHFMSRRYHKCLGCGAKNVGWIRSMAQFLLSFPRHQACKMTTLNLPISKHVNNRLNLPRSRVIYYGICDPLVGGKSFGESKSWLSLPLTLAYVGRLVREKGLVVLLRALSQLRTDGYQFGLKIVGDGPERADLEEMAIALGLQGHVSFTGWLQGDSLQRVLQDVSVVVMATLMEETAGLAAIEQMMRGRLVVVSDIGGLAEVVDGVGLKFEVGDAAGLAACIRRALDDPNIVTALGRRARERALRLFLDERMVAEHAALYGDLINESGVSSINLGRA